MSAVKVEVIEDFMADQFHIIVDGKRVASMSFTPFASALAESLKLVFDAMDVENVEVVIR
jgi:hypothetical protein